MLGVAQSHQLSGSKDEKFQNQLKQPNKKQSIPGFQEPTSVSYCD